MRHFFRRDHSAARIRPHRKKRIPSPPHSRTPALFPLPIPGLTKRLLSVLPIGVHDLRHILEKAQPSGGAVSSDLLPFLYHELRNLAASYMARQVPGNTLQPTALVHEAWLKLAKEDERLWSSRAHFFRAAAQVMRCILVDRARGKATMKHGENARPVDIHDLALAVPTMDERVLLVDEVLDRLERENPDNARVIILKFFGGLTNKEIATLDGVTERTVERRWTYAKARLFQMIQEETGRVEVRATQP